jgi:hypothetical protein
MRSTRRSTLKALGVTAGAVALGSFETLARAASSAHTQARGDADPRGDAAGPWADLKGAVFATATVTDVGPIEHGSIPVTFVDSQGQSFVVDVLRHDAARPGVARAGTLSVYMRVGKGQRATHEAHGLTAMAFAAELARREERGAPVPSLLTLTERAPVRTSWNRRDSRVA